jgi:ribosomal protein S21
MMGLRVVVGEGEVVARAYRRLAQRMVDGGVFDEMRLAHRFESQRAKRRLKQALKRERAQDRAAWESHGIAVPDFAQ